jgi:hypothetical protein
MIWDVVWYHQTLIYQWYQHYHYITIIFNVCNILQSFILWYNTYM